MIRPSKRDFNELRNIEIIRKYTKYAEGAVLISYGETKVLCTASILEGVPRFLKGCQKGWITAEYGMLPRATSVRTDREATRGKQGGRTLEIQRLIGRSLRSVVNLDNLGEFTIQLDCDVLQADGGTRTAAITGSCVALVDALIYHTRRQKIQKPLFHHLIGSVSVGIFNEHLLLDLDYTEDSNAQTDMNIVMNEKMQFIEIQGTAESKPFLQTECLGLLNLAEQGIRHIIQKQKEALGNDLDILR